MRIKIVNAELIEDVVSEGRRKLLLRFNLPLYPILEQFEATRDNYFRDLELASDRLFASIVNYLFWEDLGMEYVKIVCVDATLHCAENTSLQDIAEAINRAVIQKGWPYFRLIR